MSSGASDAAAQPDSHPGQAPDDPLLPGRLKYRLWRRVDRRLQKGEVLITTEQFQQVMEREFKKLIRSSPTPRIRRRIHEMIAAVNERHPETFLALGIRNALTRFFRDAEARLQGRPAEIREEGRRRIKQMIKEGRTGLFLESIGVELEAAGLTPAIEAAILRIVEGKKLHPPPAGGRPVRRRRPSGMATLSRSETAAGGGQAGEEKPAQEALPGEKEQQERIHRERARQEEIARTQMEGAGRHLDSYAQQELLAEDEVLDLRTLLEAQERLRKGEIDAAEAERLRSTIDATRRANLEKKLRKAVDYAVHYLNTFEALKRIPPERDAALRLLIENKYLVTSDDEEADFSPMLIELEQNSELLDNLIAIMERKDQEVRMIAANLPPYRHIVAQEGETIAQLVIDERFVGELRQLGPDELAERLNSPEAAVRVKPAAAMRCLVALINHVVRPTRFHRELRRLKVRQTIMRLYGSSDSKKEGRSRVQQFLRIRLHALYPELTAKDRGDIEQDSREVMDAMDQDGKKVEEERFKNEVRVYRA